MFARTKVLKGYTGVTRVSPSRVAQKNFDSPFKLILSAKLWIKDLEFRLHQPTYPFIQLYKG